MQNRSVMTTIQLLVDVDLPKAEHQALPSTKDLRQWIEQALASIDEPCEADLELELSVRFCNSEAIRSLNSDFRQRDSATNVLSFPSGMPILTTDNGQGLQPLGDIVLCPTLIEQEAAEQSKAIMDHYCHLVIHGVLHLCGYDHDDDASARTMESLEIQILSGLGIASPYQQIC